MQKYILFIFLVNLIMSPINGTTCNTSINHLTQSNDKIKLGLKTLGAAGGYFITYKMFKAFEKSIQKGPDVIPGKGLVIDIAFIPAGIIGLASFALGTTFLISTLKQSFSIQEKQNEIEKYKTFQKGYSLQTEKAYQQQLLMHYFKL